MVLEDAGFLAFVSLQIRVTVSLQSMITCNIQQTRIATSCQRRQFAKMETNGLWIQTNIEGVLTNSNTEAIMIKKCLTTHFMRNGLAAAPKKSDRAGKGHHTFCHAERLWHGLGPRLIIRKTNSLQKLDIGWLQSEQWYSCTWFHFEKTLLKTSKIKESVR